MWGWLIGAVCLLAALLYWLLVTTEGTYLGRRVVVLLYDWTARRYDKIKAVQFLQELQFVGVPLARELEGNPAPRILDVATGTGRLATALEGLLPKGSLLIGGDASWRMLQHSAPQHRLLTEAEHLCLASDTFDCVCCLEALEFISNADQALREMIRVGEPGALLMLTNRVGRDAWFYPGRIAGRGRLEQRLLALGCSHVRTQRWQVHYDLVWARTPRGDLASTQNDTRDGDDKQ